ncbi:MAG: phosphoesterase [Pseudomonadota bacterium]|nr:phosphoesterase [Pseudomonadota bacterium]
MSRIIAARALSIIGHPAVLVPAAVTLSALGQDASTGTILVALLAVLSVSTSLVIYSFAQVRAGRWSHVDASIPDERSQLNPLLALMLVAVASALLATTQDTQVVAGLVMAAVMVMAAHLLRTWFKASLHVSFAVFSVFLVWPSTVTAAVVLALAGAISWSRLVLHRHTVLEVVAGTALGVAAGAGFRLAITSMAGVLGDG